MLGTTRRAPKITTETHVTTSTATNVTMTTADTVIGGASTTRRDHIMTDHMIDHMTDRITTRDTNLIIGRETRTSFIGREAVDFNNFQI